MANTKGEVAVFTKTQKDLAKYEEDFKVVPDTSTEDGYAFVKSACSVLTKARTTVEKARKEAKQPLIDAGKKIDEDAKAITERIIALEEPMKAAKALQDNKEAIAKAERIARLKEEVNKIARYVDRAKGLSSSEILEIIEAVKCIDTSAGYYDLTAEATQCQADTLNTLGEMYSAQFSFEDQEAQRIKAEAENQKLIRDQQISERINNLKQMPLSLFGKPSSEIQSKITAMEKYEPSEDDFGDRLPEVINDQAAVITQLKQMLSMAVASESAEVVKKEVEFKEIKSYCIAQLTSEEVEHGLRVLSSNIGQFTGNSVFDECYAAVTAHYEKLKESESEVEKARKAVQSESKSNYVDGVAVGVKAPELKPDPEVKPLTLQDQVIQVAESYAYKWGVMIDEAEMMKADLAKLFN